MQGCRGNTAKDDFDARERISRLGIRADIANYKRVEQPLN
jgi:hypothetical protein